MDITIEEWNTEMEGERERERERWREEGQNKVREKIMDGERRCLCLRTDSGSRSN